MADATTGPASAVEAPGPEPVTALTSKPPSPPSPSPASPASPPSTSARASEMPPLPSALATTEPPSQKSSAPVSPTDPVSALNAASHSTNATAAAAKDDAPSEPEPSGYGTRSRRSGATRPNYADPDHDLEDMIMENQKSDDLSSSKRSTPSDSIKARPSTEGGAAAAATTTTATTATPVTTGPTKLRLNFNSNPSPASASADKAAAAPPERKKRKYERRIDKTTGSPAAAIPGTSSFFASPQNGGDHPTKKRKTGENLPASAAASSSPGVTTATRKASVQSPKYGPKESQVVTFTKSHYRLGKDGSIEGDDGLAYAPNDHVYLICEPPGDPYYLARIMEFRRDKQDDPKSPVTRILVNWYYRPKDIGRYSVDPRCLFASMQSDECPISSLRGKCTITHRGEIEDFDEYRKQPDCFWFNQLYDRYIHRPYEIIPASAVINVPERVKKALDERWDYLVVEQARLKELTSAVKLCKRCRTYCAPNDSVDCGVCHNTYHMACVRPPLLKKPSRGFAWSCGPCSRKQERRLLSKEGIAEAEQEDELMEEEDEEHKAATTAPSPTKDEEMEDVTFNKAEMAHADLWPWRYLGIHCKVEDVLQYDDRAIYPRASSRLGPRHQANVVNWYGRPVELVKPADAKRKWGRGQPKKDVKPAATKDPLVTTDPEKLDKTKRPRWVQDAPPGYVPRGEDYDNDDPNCTAKRLWITPDEKPQPTSGFSAVNRAAEEPEKKVEEYMEEVYKLASEYDQARAYEYTVKNATKKIEQVSSNYLDKALELFMKHKYNKAAALADLKENHTNAKLGNPEFSKAELARFEEGILKHGTEFRHVRKMVKSKSYGQVVRYYYTWKSTPRGREIRARHEGRRGAKKGRAEASWTEIADEEDDSAFDNIKAEKHRRQFVCKFCSTTHSRQWRRAPNTAPGAVELIDPKGSTKDKGNQLVVSLCNRCAIMWRKYGMRFEDADEVAKSLHASGGRAWKRKLDEELLREIIHANEAARVPTPAIAAQAAASIGLTVTVHPEPPKAKKAKLGSDKDTTPQPTLQKPRARSPPAPPPRLPTPPPVPNPAKLREFDCAVCKTRADTENGPRIMCKDCRLTVHRVCFGIAESVQAENWSCGTCLNDRNPTVSLDYTCCICRQPEREVELIEQPKVSHKKKTDRDREKERLEQELRLKLRTEYIDNQRRLGKPIFPREALKKTVSNNWVHLTCAIFMPEIKFATPDTMEDAEGMGAVVANPARGDRVCKICLLDVGFNVTCQSCTVPFHPSCALEAGNPYGFDLTPVKSTRKDMVPTVSFPEETGVMTAAIWCKAHKPETIIHPLNEKTTRQDGMTALQAFVHEYKTPDLALTGTARKANLVTQSTKSVSVANAGNRRTSNMTNGTLKHRASLADVSNHVPQTPNEKHQCAHCGSSCGIKWYPADSVRKHHANGVNGHAYNDNGPELCHKCYTRALKGDELVHSRVNGNGDGEELAGDMPEVNYFEKVAPPRPPVLPIYQQPPMMPGMPQPPAPPPYPGAPAVAPVGGLAHSPGLLHGKEDSDFSQKIKALRVTITNEQLGRSHQLTPQEIKLSLDDSPNPSFQYLLDTITTYCGFDRSRHIIMSHENIPITTAENFIKVMVSLINYGPGHATWYIKDHREVPVSHSLGARPPGPQAAVQEPPLPPMAHALHHAGGYPGPPPPPGPPGPSHHAHAHSHSHSLSHSHASHHGYPSPNGAPSVSAYPPIPPSGQAGPPPPLYGAPPRGHLAPQPPPAYHAPPAHYPHGPPPHGPPPPHQHQQGSILPALGPAPRAYGHAHSLSSGAHPAVPGSRNDTPNGARPSPHYTTATLAPPNGTVSGYPVLAPGAASPPARSSTPRDVKPLTGASSSPNLRNLMH